MGQPRLGRGAKSNWRNKLDPLFLESALALKTAVLKQSRGVPTAEEEYFGEIEKLRQRFPARRAGPPLPVDIVYSSPGTQPLSANDEEGGLLAWMHWHRFWTPLWQDALRARSGDIAASRRITATITDYDERRGNPSWQPKFKADLDHGDMFEMGLGLGVEVLTESELADCFDALCPCGRRHNPDALRRQRIRFVNALREAFWCEMNTSGSHLVLWQIERISGRLRADRIPGKG